MVSNLGSLEEFLVNAPIQINLGYLVLALILAAVLSFILGNIYSKYGTSLSNRKKFAGNFVLLTTTTTLVIIIVKSSLALALGLVGALSIVRFRAAIKEPEELSFLFLCIALGLGLGSGQLKTTLVSFAIISGFIFLRKFTYKKEQNQNLILNVSGKNLVLKSVVDVLKKNSNSIHLKRFDEVGDGKIEASFLIDFESFDQLEKAKVDLNKLSKSISITYIDKSGIY